MWQSIVFVVGVAMFLGGSFRIPSLIPYSIREPLFVPVVLSWVGAYLMGIGVGVGFGLGQ